MFPVRLAAMDGMTHAAFRSVCFEYGADGATTEMLAAASYGRAKHRRMKHFEPLLMRYPQEKLLSAQIIGSDRPSMAEAARRLSDRGTFDAVEINMGCPARKVVGSGNGAALLQNVPPAIELLNAVCEASSIPVWLKLRLGWDDKHPVAAELAQAAEAAGCAAVILHGRTREQMYRGEADIDAMRAVTAAVHIPVYANGGVRRAADARSFMERTGAQGVCIGRAALKQPWIFDDIRRLEAGEPIPERDARERIGVLLRLAERSLPMKPERYAICEMRKFCGWYLPGLTDAPSILKALNDITTRDAFRARLEGYLDRLERADDLRVHTELMPEETLDTV